MTKPTLIRGGTIVRAEEMDQVDVLIDGGHIQHIGEHVDVKPHTTHPVKADGKFLLPGLIDCHVHFREPGLEEKGTMATESRSARAGGVTCVCEMPNTIPSTTTIAALADKVRRASAITDCDIRFFFGITSEDHLATLRELFTGESEELLRLKKHCCGVKLYLDHSTGNQKVDGGIVEDIFKTCAELDIVLVAHCEDADMNASMEKANVDQDISAHSRIRSAESEAKAIEYAIGLSKKHGTKFHVAHLSTAPGIELVRQAKKQGLPVTCEVAPHHLFLTIDDYKTLGTLAKMNPPLRSAVHQRALWDGIADGTVDCISTDHAPHTLAEKKTEPPLKAPSGVPGVETMLPLLLTVASGGWPHPNGQRQISDFTIQDIVRLCFDNPNKIFGLGKQGIHLKSKADIVIVDTDKEWVIQGKDLHSKCGWTPFEGWKVRGKVLPLTLPQ